MEAKNVALSVTTLNEISAAHDARHIRRLQANGRNPDSANMTHAGDFDSVDTMKIRPFQPGDVETLALLFTTTVHEINSRDYSAAQVHAWAPPTPDLERWRASFIGKIVYVAEVADRPRGFAELEPNGHIDRFYIDAKNMGRGLGRALYETVELQANALKLEKLFVEASLTAKPFFERMGFRVVQEQTVSVRGVQMNNFVMEKALARPRPTPPMA